MTELERHIQEITPGLYHAQAEAMGLPVWKDMSHSHQCQPMSFHMMQALTNRGHVLRRELHQDENGNWHYLLAHTKEDADPTEHDLVTDLNPWQYTADAKVSGPLHARRDEIMDRLRLEQAPEFFVALRGLETIVQTHKPDW